MNSEKAGQKAKNTVFPTCKLFSYLFHLEQGLGGKVKCKKKISLLHKLHIENMKTTIICKKKLLALSFVPLLHQVITAFEVLSETYSGVLEKVCEYWEDNYSGREKQNRQVTARFPVTFRNVRDRCRRTWYEQITQLRDGIMHPVDCHHPNVCKLIDHFRKEHKFTEDKMVQHNGGERKKAASKSKYLKLDEYFQLITPYQEWNFYVALHIVFDFVIYSFNWFNKIVTFIT
ncbi:hypothetical protein HELRODRAFT_162499 [Helobdella robusta]|uniref:Uncharacterized protein n=1 Tax=Helobdella robusta TaxID=6412 RepID=T1ESR3_HELRO|nr:hypothetical protein HELRODRAFT_162499 [Helobdella robusta]ESN99021.1 hypothetical protein HELRODRAFT_162499 [Helobdella robusta]